MIIKANWTLDPEAFNRPLGPPDTRPWTLSTTKCERCGVFHMVPPPGYDHEDELVKALSQSISDEIDNEIVQELRTWYRRWKITAHRRTRKFKKRKLA